MLPCNAVESIVSTEFGIEIVGRLVQFLNAFAKIVFTYGKVTLVRLV